MSPETFDGVDPVTGVPFCQVKVHVGPSSNLFALNSIGHEFTDDGGAPVAFNLDYVPVLIKVVMNPAAVEYNLELEYLDVAGSFNPGAKPGLAWSDVRGLVGVRALTAAEIQSL